MKRVLIIYTGGTIGMKTNPSTGALAPVDFSQIQAEIPEIKKFNAQIDSITYDPIMDSSNASSKDWVEMAKLIDANYNKYDGFVILHGTDTMAYAASGLSFMLCNLAKPVIFTGSQLPMGVLRTDGRENLISAIEIAANGVVNEVCIYFQTKLLRGNRTTKQNAEYFDAFISYNYPPIATAGINIRYDYSLLLPQPSGAFCINTNIDEAISVVKIFPGIKEEILRAHLAIKGLRAIVLESYGAGNAPNETWFIDLIKEASLKGVVILNVTQCAIGSVNMSIYETGKSLMQIGVISGFDITIEAAIAKLMHLLGNYDNKEVAQKLTLSLRAEISLE